jgi:nudix-type nucleoside diphosphatase (YffH/AdpP family)
MNDKIRLIGTEVLSNAWGRLTRATLDYRRDDGMVQRLSRENYDHGNAASILLLNPARRTVLLVRQFRYPVFANGDPAFLLEACAGLLDGDDPLTCARREALEETGHEPKNIEYVSDVYTSPGSVQEKVSLSSKRAKKWKWWRWGSMTPLPPVAMAASPTARPWC